MSFVFKAFTKSRRKKNKGRLTKISEVTTTIGGEDNHHHTTSKLSSSTLVDDHPKQQGYRRNNLLTVSQTDEEDDDRTHPMNEQSPSHCSGASNTTTTAASFSGIPLTPPVSSIKGSSNKSSRGLSSSTTIEPSRRSLFKSLRRKSEVDHQSVVVSHNNTTVMGTPDTVATASSLSSPARTTGQLARKNNSNNKVIQVHRRYGEGSKINFLKFTCQQNRYEES